MFEIMGPDEAVELIHDGDCICVNSFVGIENPVELHEAIYRRYHSTDTPKNLTIVSSAGFGVWDEDHNAERYIREGAVSRLICGHFGAMLSTKKIVQEDRFEAYNLPLGCISHAIRAQAADREEPCRRWDWTSLSIPAGKAPGSTGFQNPGIW